jgi:hypothetical protein
MFPSGWFLAPAFAGVSLLLFALFYWVWGQRRRSLFLRWVSLVQVAFALCAGFAVAGSLAPPHLFALWSDLELGALFLGGCALVVAFVYGVREALRGSRLQRYEMRRRH